MHGDKPAEEGYVEKQRQVLTKRKNIIPLNQALYGASSLSPVGNKIAKRLEQIGIIPDATLWCIASGSNLYGVGNKIKQKFSNGRVYVVEPEVTATIPKDLDLKNPLEIKEFSKKNIKNYSLDEWVNGGRKGSGAWPLHAKHPSMYLLRLWSKTGNIGFDEIIHLSTQKMNETQIKIKDLNPEYNWTKTTALTLNPAIELAKQGKNVLVMAYGKHRENKFQDIIMNGGETD